ncbi:hypothetical protein [Streptomyces sp. NRRL F-5123]|uniref:hypothetical protein n=1 Tax=Streptomyces sp. NRRL F-5123 TaxID=1463856 RepID=UPI0006939AFE|nr:hypothetical protein [Streptomyces sp. NRRL F-5123]
MGFSGTLVFCRSERPLAEAEVFDTLQEEVLEELAERGEWWPRSGGWRTAAVGGDYWDEETLREIVEGSAAPACLGYVYDSDVVYIRGLTPSGREWAATVGMESAAALRVEPPDDLEADPIHWYSSAQCAEAIARKVAEFDADVPQDARDALAWAVEAGFGSGVEVAAIEALLRSKPEPFAEELFCDLLDALGFPAAEEPIPAP